MTEERKLESAIHHHLMRGLIDNGFAPDIARLQELVAAEPESVAAALKRLEASHSVVCHPHHDINTSRTTPGSLPGLSNPPTPIASPSNPLRMSSFLSPKFGPQPTHSPGNCQDFSNSL